MRRLRALLALGCAAGCLYALAAPPSPAQGPSAIETASGATAVERGRALFVDGCSSCHGIDARGIHGVAPTLRGVGAAAADFYLATGRMPLAAIGDQPVRSKPAYTNAQIADLVAYVGSYGGPPIPSVDTTAGSLSEGQRLFADHCAGCHQIVAQGGMVTGAQVPDLQDATPQQIAEAVRIGPYVMPRFGERQLDDEELASVTRYVLSTRDPDDRGGWGIGHLGPIPEGMVAWLLGLAAIVLAIRIIGERTTE
jgi:ubiquinol-cytochrome c reductase cytochrome c subunit